MCRRRRRRGERKWNATAVKLQPLGDRVVVQPAEREKTTRSGIVIPDTAKEKPQERDRGGQGPS